MNPSAFAVAPILAAFLAGPVVAETLNATTRFNSASQKPAATQPEAGVAVAYPVVYGGDLDGCTAAVAETLFPKDDAAWGLFEVVIDVTCPDGGFAFTSAGSWDDAGFHGAGAVKDGSGTGRFAGLAGQLAQSGTLTAAADGTTDLAYDLRIDRAAP